MPLLQWQSEPIFQISNFFSIAECASCIKYAEENGFNKAKFYYKGRKNFEFFSDNERLAEEFIERLKVNLNMTNIQISVPLEFYKYGLNDTIVEHIDAPKKISEVIFSSKTALLYLNDDFKGGSTWFPQQNINLVPSTGSLVLFDQGNLPHEAKPVTRGTKYILRTNLAII